MMWRTKTAKKLVATLTKEQAKKFAEELGNELDIVNSIGKLYDIN